MILTRSTRTIVSLMAIVLATSLSGCGDDSDGKPTGSAAAQPPAATPGPTPSETQVAGGQDLASCYAGEGESNGTKLYATLRLTEGLSDAVTGTYLVGETKTGGIPYAVSGSLKDGKLDTVFTAAGQGLNVTGTVDMNKVKLDNPEGKFGVTDFTAGCS